MKTFAEVRGDALPFYKTNLRFGGFVSISVQWHLRMSRKYREISTPLVVIIVYCPTTKSNLLLQEFHY